MADITNPTGNVTIFSGDNPALAKAITGTTDGSKERLDVSLPTNNVSGDVEVILHSHAVIHDGVAYVASEYLTLSASTTRVHLMKVPTGYSAHMFMVISASLQTKIEIYENPTVSANGTAMTAINRNRISANTANVAAYHTPTTSANGTLLYTSFVPGSNQGGQILGTSQEFDYKENEDYLIVITSLANGNEMTIEHNWYEVAV